MKNRSHALRDAHWRNQFLAGFAVLSFTLAGEAALAAEIFRDDFESGNLSKTQGAARWGGSNFGSTDNVRLSTANPKMGNYSLEFTYTGSTDPNDDAFAEQRFAFGANYTEAWIKYDLYVPGNYAHRVVSPANNKFLAIYRDPYGALGYQVNFSTGPNGSGGSDLGTHYYENGVEGRVIYPASARSFLTAADAGKWRRIVVHMKTPTTPTNLRRLP